MTVLPAARSRSRAGCPRRTPPASSIRPSRSVGRSTRSASPRRSPRRAWRRTSSWTAREPSRPAPSTWASRPSTSSALRPVWLSSRPRVWLLAVALPGHAAAQGLYLHEIPTELDAGSAGRDGPLRVRAFVADPPALAAALPAAARVVGGDHIEIELAAYPELEPREPERYRAGTFVIDYDEPAMRRLRETLVSRYGDAPSLEQLRRFAGDSIPRKSMSRGFDLASRVARTGTGDCTEHAVLLTALARAVGRPARVALGLLIVRMEGEAHALGHAWAEIYDGAHWVPVDATPVADETLGLAYLPLSLLTDEGPGYTAGLGRRLQRGWVQRVEVAGGAVAAGAGGGAR